LIIKKEQTLQIKLPAETKKELRRRATEEDVTIRTIVLRALAKDGFPVPAGEIQDRRKSK
jgi:hypothetical protein